MDREDYLCGGGGFPLHFGLVPVFFTAGPGSVPGFSPVYPQDCAGRPHAMVGFPAAA